MPGRHFLESGFDLDGAVSGDVLFVDVDGIIRPQAPLGFEIVAEGYYDQAVTQAVSRTDTGTTWVTVTDSQITVMPDARELELVGQCGGTRGNAATAGKAYLRVVETTGGGSVQKNYWEGPMPGVALAAVSPILPVVNIGVVEAIRTFELQAGVSHALGSGQTVLWTVANGPGVPSFLRAIARIGPS